MCFPPSEHDACDLQAPSSEGSGAAHRTESLQSQPLFKGFSTFSSRPASGAGSASVVQRPRGGPQKAWWQVATAAEPTATGSTQQVTRKGVDARISAAPSQERGVLSARPHQANDSPKQLPVHKGSSTATHRHASDASSSPGTARPNPEADDGGGGAAVWSAEDESDARGGGGAGSQRKRKPPSGATTAKPAAKASRSSASSLARSVVSSGVSTQAGAAAAKDSPNARVKETSVSASPNDEKTASAAEAVVQTATNKRQGKEPREAARRLPNFPKTSASKPTPPPTTMKVAATTMETTRKTTTHKKKPLNDRDDVEDDDLMAVDTNEDESEDDVLSANVHDSDEDEPETMQSGTASLASSRHLPRASPSRAGAAVVKVPKLRASPKKTVADTDRYAVTQASSAQGVDVTASSARTVAGGGTRGSSSRRDKVRMAQLRRTKPLSRRLPPHAHQDDGDHDSVGDSINDNDEEEDDDDDALEMFGIDSGRDPKGTQSKASRVNEETHHHAHIRESCHSHSAIVSVRVCVNEKRRTRERMDMIMAGCIYQLNKDQRQATTTHGPQHISRPVQFRQVSNENVSFGRAGS